MAQTITTERLLSQLEERALDAHSLTDAQVILRGLATVLADLGNNPALPQRNQGIATSAGDLALHAMIVRASNVSGEAA